MTLSEEMRSGETRNGVVSFVKLLSDGELIDSVMSVTPSSEDVTIISSSVSTKALKIKNKTVPIGMAVQYSVTSTTPATYTLSVMIDTNSTPPQELIEDITLIVTATS